MKKIQQVIALREVSGDLVDGKHFYDFIEPGVGDYFWDSIMADMKSLLLYGGIHQRMHGLYRMPAKRFPYSIYYTMEQSNVYVVAVLPMRRSPHGIVQTLTGRTKK
ncbi:hypothetical protein [Desulfonatronum lacustre]|uniref:hypothetical protein n=1 Tax=Desulfonatronum lacustre TaxID=66849 RepID=UPI000686192E|nr:hypothetical protein [Desulfonatronum lacustre]SMP47350.1 hypothetical protein SAMN06295888_104139 [Desulfonatronum zhilinae]